MCYEPVLDKATQNQMELVKIMLTYDIRIAQRIVME